MTVNSGKRIHAQLIVESMLDRLLEDKHIGLEIRCMEFSELQSLGEELVDLVETYL